VIKQLATIVSNEVVGKINNKQKEVFRKILDNSERLKKIIDDLLDISRIERNTLKLHYSLVDVVDLMKDSEGFFTKLAEEKNISLRYIYPHEPVNVFIDPDRIRQVISNLISNAIKFTMDGGRIKIEVKILESKVRIGVIDTGIGISRTDLPSIFNKFTQVSKLPGAENKGVGLGLSISKKLVERHKGEIWVESKTGVGSKFYFTLLRFYTLDMLGKEAREKVSKLMKSGVSMHFVSLMILNCPEFRKRMGFGSESLFKDLRAILDAALKSVNLRDSDKQAMVIINPRAGKFSIILPGVSNRQAANISNLLKHKIKQYFANNKVEDVFITIGSLSYSQKIFSHDDGLSPSKFSIKEIYIGSEMRRFKRISFKTNIKLFLPEEKMELSESVDVSERGICLIIRRLLKTDSQLKLSFVFPENKEFTITAKVRVAWIKKMGMLFGEGVDKYKVGLEFINLENKYKKAICKRLAKLS
jgi:two-component sensor histidine kinase